MPFGPINGDSDEQQHGRKKIYAEGPPMTTASSCQNPSKTPA